MKRLLLAAIALCLFANSSLAQLNLGVKAGLNMSNLNAVYKGGAPSLAEFKSKPSFHVGALAQVPILGLMAFQAEALLSGKGGKFDGPGAENVNLYYVSVPLLAVYRPVPVIGIQGGVELNYLVSARQKIDGRNQDIADDFKDNDVGLIGGVQFQIRKINLDARYIYGLTRIREVVYTDANGNNSSARYNNSLFQVSVGYFFLM